jgi:two-component system response regulator FixJ
MNETEELPLMNYKMPLEIKQIYILDDDEAVLRALKLLMVSYGFAVDMFSSAGEFFCVVPNNASGCLILDIHMAGLNGWDTLRRLTETGSKLSVIVITADKDERFKERALKAGAVGYLQKPFEDLSLLHMVTRVFDKTGGHNEKRK